MNPKRASWIITFIIALLITGCGTGTKDQSKLKPPSVYREPQVKVTHAPTEVVADPSTIEAAPSGTVEFVENQQDSEATTDAEDQSLMDELDNQLTKIENDLDRMDTNP